LGAIIGQFKSRITKCVWALPANEKSPIWQRNDYESIVRDKTHFKRIWAYIENNPRQWEADQLHPAAPPNRFNRDTIQE
jgi:REP element-mobilizing transposase RayT